MNKKLPVLQQKSGGCHTIDTIATARPSRKPEIRIPKRETTPKPEGENSSQAANNLDGSSTIALSAADAANPQVLP